MKQGMDFELAELEQETSHEDINKAIQYVGYQTDRYFIRVFRA